MKVTILGIDLSKSSFQLHGVDGRGKTVLTRKLTRAKLMPFMANLPPCVVGMEACGSAHWWARNFAQLGHTVRLVAPQFVKPYVKSNKNDAADAEAICEAIDRPNMRFVPVKPVACQDIQCLHRARKRLVRNRTALANEIRGLLAEYGIVIATSMSQLYRAMPRILEDGDNDLTPMGRETFSDLLEELKQMETRLAHFDARIKALVHQSEPAKRLMTIPGVGPLSATAILAAVADAGVFANGRQFAAWLGLVPRQHSTGGVPRLLGISKRGDKYVRTLLVHGARSVIRHMDGKEDKRSRWLQQLVARVGFNRACVAMANKNARVIWAMLKNGDPYRTSSG